MNQAELFAESTKQKTGFISGARAGYSPASKINYRGHLIPASYRETVGMRIETRPTLVWLMDEILEALQGGPILSAELAQYLSGPLEHGVVAKHESLLEDLGLIREVWPEEWPTFPAIIRPTVELVEV